MEQKIDLMLANGSPKGNYIYMNNARSSGDRFDFDAAIGDQLTTIIKAREQKRAKEEQARRLAAIPTVPDIPQLTSLENGAPIHEYMSESDVIITRGFLNKARSIKQILGKHPETGTEEIVKFHHRKIGFLPIKVIIVGRGYRIGWVSCEDARPNSYFNHYLYLLEDETLMRRPISEHRLRDKYYEPQGLIFGTKTEEVTYKGKGYWGTNGGHSNDTWIEPTLSKQVPVGQPLTSVYTSILTSIVGNEANYQKIIANNAQE